MRSFAGCAISCARASPCTRPWTSNALVREVIGLLASDAVIRGVSLRFDPLPGDLVVQGDRVQLQQVLLNIVINAMEAMATNRDHEAVVRPPHRGHRAGRVRVFRSRTRGPGLRRPPRRSLRAFLHHQAPGTRHGPVDRAIHRQAHGGTIEATNNRAEARPSRRPAYRRRREGRGAAEVTSARWCSRRPVVREHQPPLFEIPRHRRRGSFGSRRWPASRTVSTASMSTEASMGLNSTSRRRTTGRGPGRPRRRDRS